MQKKDKDGGRGRRGLTLILGAAALLPILLHLLGRRHPVPGRAGQNAPETAEPATEADGARSRFLRSIAHDLRTPLSAIIGASGTLAEGRDLPEDTRRRLAAGIGADAQWLLSMVENILSLTRADGLPLAKTTEAAEEIVARAVERFRRLYPHIKVTVAPADGLLLAPMDALLVGQALGNLLDNAARHGTPMGGCAPAIEVQLAEAEGFALFTVADNGPGLGPSALAGLFPPMPPAPEKPGAPARGRAMGLSICRSIAEAHGGWIRAESPRGGGARLTFALPLAGREDGHGE